MGGKCRKSQGLYLSPSPSPSLTFCLPFLIYTQAHAEREREIEILIDREQKKQRTKALRSLIVVCPMFSLGLLSVLTYVRISHRNSRSYLSLNNCVFIEDLLLARRCGGERRVTMMSASTYCMADARQSLLCAPCLTVTPILRRELWPLLTPCYMQRKWAVD